MPERLIDREIFTWDNRGTIVKSDPMALQRRMAEEAARLDFDPGGAVADLKLAGADLLQATEAERKGDQIAAFRAHGNLAMLTKAGFGLKSLDEDQQDGWTEAELVALLDRFWTWCEKKNQKPDGSST